MSIKTQFSALAPHQLSILRKASKGKNKKSTKRLSMALKREIIMTIYFK
jgi:hypothetical protein